MDKLLKFPKYFLLLAVLFVGCNSENVGDCFQAKGSIMQSIFTVPSFDQIQIEGNVSLFIEQGATQEVSIETGENLLPDVFVEVVDGTLIIRDTNSCNFVREYGSTIARITTPNITRIQNASSYDVVGVGELSFNSLLLVSNTSGGLADPRKGGDFYLDINTTELRVSANGQSAFYLSGNVQTANINFADENPRFEGATLRVDDLTIFQRSANKMIVFPVNSISGRIVGTGDVIAKNTPPIVEVEESFTGQLIFED
ncbi:head GIN domain-containing protein [Patiriisocius marinus]|uniref:Putative auto-transporter adhesin head GIN domain-containing protein n=1 Tax=Patiriisocius marinus TaxID=1397112 RepID=A0A5J4J436_9FLAO|nr:head GIN domain-containing protein [Patiriisocius marinus]GER60650.1 hypothetical protein ULMA_27580 [Patiriisocius marinus]